MKRQHRYRITLITNNLAVITATGTLITDLLTLITGVQAKMASLSTDPFIW